MRDLEPDTGVYLGDGEWISWDDFGPIDPDEPQDSLLPVLEWQDWIKHRYPHAELSDVRQLIRLWKAADEYHTTTGRDLNVIGALGELFGAVLWGIRLNRKPDAQGSDGRVGDDHVEIKTIGPRSKSDRVTVKLSGNFNKLLVVKVRRDADAAGRDMDRAGWDLDDIEWSGLRIASRMVARSALTKKTTGNAGLAWSRACEIGCAARVGWDCVPSRNKEIN